MREFRAWDNKNDSWVAREEMWINGIGIINYVDIPVDENDDITIEYFTGRKDNNSKKIFAGDFLHIWCKFLKKECKCAEVFWNGKMSRFDVKTRKEKYSNYFAFLNQCHWFCEIIGNKHENPELSRAKENGKKA